MWVWSDASMVYFFDFQIRACSCTLVAPCLHPREDQARIWKNRQVREVPLPPATTSENSHNWWSGRLSALYHRDRLDQDLIMLRWWPTLLIVFIKVETSIKHVWLCLGKDPATKSDEFLGKFQTAVDLPLIFGKLCCNFFIMDMVAYMQGGMKAR